MSCQSSVFAAAEIGEAGFDDSIMDEPVELPPWFKLSFLDIKEDLIEAKQSGKKGLVLYFGMERCPYCKAMIEVNFGKSDIAAYTQENFDVVAIDVRGSRSITTFAGEVISEKEFAVRNKANFTPTLLFFDHSGKEVHRMVGYYKPYTFRAVLEYVADSHYANETFRDYLSRGKRADSGADETLNYRSFSMKKPYILERNRITAQRPLLVIFEQPDCHACDVLHSGALSTDILMGQMQKLDVVQLDIWSQTPLIDSVGKKISARAWAESMGIFYTPTLVFYNENGIEVLRLSSVAHFSRLNKVLNYVTSGGYRTYKNLAEWKINQ
jgi:thioredoxin-related protein